MLYWQLTQLGVACEVIAPTLVPESLTVAICVVVAWIVGWTALGAWRMVKRDA